MHIYLKEQNTLTPLRDDALLQIGFFGALRRSEFVAIKYEAISWEKQGLIIMIPTSKTDQMHQVQHVLSPMETKIFVLSSL